VESYIPLLCLVAMAVLLWSSVLRSRSGGRPVVWSRRMVVAVALGVIGAVAVPIVVAAVLYS
jgi:hypothetical protein